MVRIIAALLSLCLLTGCASFLEREYSTSEPHSSKFWESEAAGTLRAENYQDIVNDLLLAIGQHREAVTLRLYDFGDDLAVAETLEQATTEILQETSMGAYAVEYITSSRQSQRGYYEVSVQISYRRTAEQTQSVVNATSTEALYSLLETALNEERTELAVRIGYWGENSRTRVEEIVAQIREDRELTAEPAWLVNYYPAEGAVGLIEFLLDPPEQPETELEEGETLAEEPAPEEGPEAAGGEKAENPEKSENDA